MDNYLKKLSKTDKIIYSVFWIVSIFVILITFLIPTKYSFSLVSIVVNFFLIIIIREVMKLLKVKFTRKQKIIIILTIVIIYIFYIFSIINRQFIYYWDYSCYYNIQLSSAEKFANGLLEGIRYFIGSTWSGEYGNFLSFIPEFVFNFTNKSINSFLLSCVIVYIPYIVFSVAIMLKIFMDKFKISQANSFFTSALFACILFPILHATLIYGQPDIFGLAFIFLIIALTIDYDFKEIEFNRLFLILITTFMLIISRRWYLYWIIAFYLCYIVKIIIDNLKNVKQLAEILKNIILYGIVVIIFFGLTLFPLIKNILFSNVGDYSEFYLTGGFSQEIINQVNHLGYLIIIIMIIGIIYGLIKNKHRLTTILSVVQYFIIIFLFTRIQNMGLHHSLILIPTYLYWLYLFIFIIIENKKENITRILLVFILTFIVNFAYGVCNNTNDNLFTKVSLTVPAQDDYKEIESVAKWLQENLTEESTAYMITHNNKYNPDKFRNFYTPDKTISKYLPYGSAIIGTHKFPIELFTSKYIITTTPFESVSIEQKYNDVFNQLVEQVKFKIIKDFDMNNGYHILVYERIKAADENEKQLYLNVLEEESKLYPALYKNIIENYTIPSDT